VEPDGSTFTISLGHLVDNEKLHWSREASRREKRGPRSYLIPGRLGAGILIPPDESMRTRAALLLIEKKPMESAGCKKRG
jgi:hypothetical protein